VSITVTSHSHCPRRATRAPDQHLQVETVHAVDGTRGDACIRRGRGRALAGESVGREGGEERGRGDVGARRELAVDGFPFSITS
jgi:hypothetical protein